ncbi:MAG TPA: HAD-IB family hydrolase [Gaiellaceae bacterium]
MSAAAFFDLDRTLIRRSSTLALAGPLRERGVISRWQLARSAVWQLVFAARGVGAERIRSGAEDSMRLLAGFGVDEMRAVVGDAMEPILRPLLYAEPLRLVQRHRDRGERVYIVSTALQEIVEHLAADLGFDGAVGSTCEIVGGRYTGRPLRAVHGEAKASAVRELAARDGLDLAASTAYSDSHSDLPFLEAVGRPLAVNPDAALRRVAAARGWPVLDFDELLLPPAPRAVPAAALAVPFAVGVWAASRRRAA